MLSPQFCLPHVSPCSLTCILFSVLFPPFSSAPHSSSLGSFITLFFFALTSLSSAAPSISAGKQSDARQNFKYDRDFLIKFSQYDRAPPGLDKTECYRHKDSTSLYVIRVQCMYTVHEMLTCTRGDAYMYMYTRGCLHVHVHEGCLHVHVHEGMLTCTQGDAYMYMRGCLHVQYLPKLSAWIEPDLD